MGQVGLITGFPDGHSPVAISVSETRPRPARVALIYRRGVDKNAAKNLGNEFICEDRNVGYHTRGEYHTTVV